MAWVWWALVSEVALSAVLCTVSIGSKSLWQDEGASVTFARDSLIHLLRTEYGSEENQTLYYALLHWWIRLGSTEAELRSLSAIAAVAAVVATFLLARRLFGDTTAAVAGLLMASAPFAVEWAQTARGYTLVMLLAVVSTHLLLRAVERPSALRLALYGASIVGAVYAGDFGALLLVAHGIWLVAGHRHDGATGRFLATGLGIGALLVPVAVFVAHARGSGVTWIPPLSVSRIKTAAYELAGGEVVFWALLATALAGVALILRRRASGFWGDFGAAATSDRSLLVYWLAVPVVLTLAISSYEPLLVGRYLLICLPAALILVARAVVALPASARLVVTVGLVVLGLLGTVSWYRHPSIQNFRAAAAMVAKGHPRTVIEYPYRLDALTYYLGRDGYPPGSYRLVTATSRAALTAAATRASGGGLWMVNLLIRSSPKHHDISIGAEASLLKSLGRASAENQRIFPSHSASTLDVAALTVGH